jgi:hypothetical protein
MMIIGACKAPLSERGAGLGASNVTKWVLANYLLLFGWNILNVRFV